MSWEVFFTPHTDDETIGMGGSIARAHAAGRKTCVVLVTDNMPSTRGMKQFADTNQNIFTARRDEWRHAMEELSVDKLYEWDVSEAMLFMNWVNAQYSVYLRMRDLILDDLKDVHTAHTTWGFWDIHKADISSVAHAICSNSLARVAARHGVHSLLHAIYLYSFPKDERKVPLYLELTDAEMLLKRSAMDRYKAGENSLGYGYRSVPDLFNADAEDNREFIIDLSTT